MNKRRDFMKQVAAFAATTGLPGSIRRAVAIDPLPGTTFMDAEHVVILMQENRSFDHCYGSLQGVRGFNDPRAVRLPNGNPVWLQSNQAGQTWSPFRLDLKGSNSTWLGCLPHDWPDQSKARHDGRYDKWLDYKRSHRKDIADKPMTLGYHIREDIPYYYALADAFTVCDQNFCSSLTGTNPNRLHLWSGTVRSEPRADSKACIRNGDSDNRDGVHWKTFPERLEELGIPWRVYQNELYLPTGLSEAETPWLGNFGDNPLEYFSQYGVRFAPQHRRYLEARVSELTAEVGRLQAEPKPLSPEAEKALREAERDLQWHREEAERWSEAAFQARPERERAIHRRAFAINDGDPDFRTLETVRYKDGDTERQMEVPKGDLFHRFRADVRDGTLPPVSWLVAPQVCSDHPDSPWYGAWYLAEAIDILTSRPEVWQKTIFILCYDENDGYFDHVPPFVPPDPRDPASGATAIPDTELEFVREEQEGQYKKAWPESSTHAGPIGLGYRVPLVIASPWSRGGYVNSQVFDHTSILQFLETWLSGKTGKSVRESNITPWRRAMCGDLSSAFRPASDGASKALHKVDRAPFFAAIHQAQFRPHPTVPKPLTEEELARARNSPASLPALPRQEPGTRPACALPYELDAPARLSDDGSSLVIRFIAGNQRFGGRAAGAPFHVYSPAPCRPRGGGERAPGRTWAIATAAGSETPYSWALDDFAESIPHLRVHGPNGFFREIRSAHVDPLPEVTVEATDDGGARLTLTPRPGQPSLTVTLTDASYGAAPISIELRGAPVQKEIPLAGSHGWYDWIVKTAGNAVCFRRLAGHLETGRDSRTDPLMGGAV